MGAQADSVVASTQLANSHSLPWFGTIEGFALVPPEGSLIINDDPAAVIVLTEGGQLMVHDLATATPAPLSLPLQELPQVSVTRVVSSAADSAGQPSTSLHAITLDRLRVSNTPISEQMQQVHSCSLSMHRPC